MPPSPSAQSPSSQSSAPVDTSVPAKLQLHTYHCLCSTVLLATPYLVSSLPRRALPAKDRARILPLPTLRNQERGSGAGEDDDDNEDGSGQESTDQQHHDESGSGTAAPSRRQHPRLTARNQPAPMQKDAYLPSLLLPPLRPARKIIVLQREDGWERRRVWHCGRCGVGVGYEIESEPKEEMRVMYLLEGGLLRTEEMLAAGESLS